MSVFDARSVSTQWERFRELKLGQQMTFDNTTFHNHKCILPFRYLTVLRVARNALYGHSPAKKSCQSWHPKVMVQAS